MTVSDTLVVSVADIGDFSVSSSFDVSGVTMTIGTLTVTTNNLPWNSAWDAEVQSEVTDALNAYDPPTNTEMNTLINALDTAQDAQHALTQAALVRTNAAVYDSVTRSSNVLTLANGATQTIDTNGRTTMESS
jgi:hypothetical protein